jgi:hypothetical protein
MGQTFAALAFALCVVQELLSGLYSGSKWFDIDSQRNI